MARKQEPLLRIKSFWLGAVLSEHSFCWSNCQVIIIVTKMGLDQMRNGYFPTVYSLSFVCNNMSCSTIVWNALGVESTYGEKLNGGSGK